MSGGSLLALGMALLAVLPCLGRAPDFEREPQKVERRALLQFPNGKKIKVDVVDTPESRASGLMFRKKLAPDYGMLFVFPTETSLSFWMKNTFIPLSIAFFDHNNRLIEIQDMSVLSSMDKALPLYKSSRPAAYALEVPLHWFEENEIRQGMKFSFLNRSDSVQ